MEKAIHQKAVNHHHITREWGLHRDEIGAVHRAGGRGRRRVEILQILWSLSAFTTGLARAMAARPAALKSNVQSCCSAYRWTPQ